MCFIVFIFSSVLSRLVALILKDCPCQDSPLRLVFWLGCVLCIHVREHIILVLEPIAQASCVLVDVFFWQDWWLRGANCGVALAIQPVCSGISFYFTLFELL